MRLKILLSYLAVLGVAGTTLLGSSSTAAVTKPETTLTIFAASSLAETFSTFGAIFHRENPSISLKFSFLASSVLASQLVEGAPADVFAAASLRDLASAGNTVVSPQVFAVNNIVLAFPRRNKNLVSTFADLNKKSVKWIQCASSVACGAVTDSALKTLGTVTSKPVSYEPKVASAVSKLLSGEVDAAFIYHSDYLANRGVLRELVFPNLRTASSQYLIALVAQSNHKEESQKFVDLVFSLRGRKILVAAGFGSVH